MTNIYSFNRVAIELSQRATRIIRYAEQAQKDLDENQDLVKLLRDGIEKLKKIMLGHTQALVSQPSSETQQHLSTHAIKTACKLLSRRHKALALFPSQPIASEVFDLLRFSDQATIQNLYKEIRPCITPGHDVGAWESDFWTLYEEDHSTSYANNTMGYRIIQLPACEQSSPTTWSYLSHEFGHSIYHKLYEALEKKSKNSSLNETESYYWQLLNRNTTFNRRKWYHEVFSDLISIATFGAAGILSILESAYCSLPALTFTKLDYETHPPFQWRLEMLKNLYHADSPEFKIIDRELKEYQDAFELFKNMHIQSRQYNIEKVHSVQLKKLAHPNLTPESEILLEEIFQHLNNVDEASDMTTSKEKFQLMRDELCQCFLSAPNNEVILTTINTIWECKQEIITIKKQNEKLKSDKIEFLEEFKNILQIARYAVNSNIPYENTLSEADLNRCIGRLQAGRPISAMAQKQEPQKLKTLAKKYRRSKNIDGSTQKQTTELLSNISEKRLHISSILLSGLEYRLKCVHSLAKDMTAKRFNGFDQWFEHERQTQDLLMRSIEHSLALQKLKISTK